MFYIKSYNCCITVIVNYSVNNKSRHRDCPIASQLYTVSVFLLILRYSILKDDDVNLKSFQYDIYYHK